MLPWTNDFIYLQLTIKYIYLYIFKSLKSIFHIITILNGKMKRIDTNYINPITAIILFVH